MKIQFFTLAMCLIAAHSFSQFSIPDSTFVYDESMNKHWFYIQKDVYTFKLTGEAEYTGSTYPCVDVQDYWDGCNSKFNEFCFDPGSSMMTRAMQINQIQSEPDYEISSVALTRNQTADYTADEFYRTDDQILVTFNDPELSSTDIDVFMATYNLEMTHEPNPSLNSTVSWTYIFRIIPIKGQETTSIKLAQQIMENEPTLVKLAEPNMYSVEPLACAPTTEVGLDPGGIDGTWHIRNEGGVIWSGSTGTPDADADICDCWGEGYTGTGVTVGVIDFGGFEFTHNDFEGSNIPEAYNAQSGTFTTSNFTLTSGDGHGVNVTGTVAATPNNTGLGQRYAVGAAYGAETIPFINQSAAAAGTPTSNGQITISLQEAIGKGVDVINMSFKTDAAFGSIDIQINNATTTGRPDVDAPGGAWGIVCVAGTGNNDLVGDHFPANMSNVIGVGWSNPEDYRGSSTAPGTGGGGWTASSGEGSTYGPPTYNYDVVAPGELIMTTDLGSTYIFQKGTSFSSPIVASIASMILDKNPNLTWDEVRQLIRDGAEKVNTGTYDYNMFGGTPGYNEEMFYGRVSCINSLNLTPLSIDENTEIPDLAVFRQDADHYEVFLPDNSENLKYQLYDVSGRMLVEKPIENSSNQVTIDLSSFASGMYVLNVSNGNSLFGSAKLIK